MPPTTKHDETKADQAKNDSAKAEGNTGGQTTGNAQNEQAVPLSQSENLGKQPPTKIGDQEFDLPADQQVALKALASEATSVDSQGVERVVNRYVDGWEPAPVEPDPDEVARAAAAREAYDAHRENRLKVLGIKAEASAAATEARQSERDREEVSA